VLEDVDFFVSSRRRHTSSKRDWSSDVCSSDLCDQPAAAPVLVGEDHVTVLEYTDVRYAEYPRDLAGEEEISPLTAGYIIKAEVEIGRASCRERVRSRVVATAGGAQRVEGTGQ